MTDPKIPSGGGAYEFRQTLLDIRGHDLDLDGVLKAIQNERVATGRYPSGLIITSEQENAFLVEWRESLVSEPAPESISQLWGQPVRVMERKMTDD